MFVLDAAMGWMLGGAVGGVALIALLARQGARRRRVRDEIRMPGELTVAVRPASGPVSVQPLVQPSIQPALQPGDSVLPTPPAAESAAPAATPPQAAARTPETIRAEIAAHAERLAAARAARAAAKAAESAEPPRPVFDPTRSTPWQQVVESVARARAGEPVATGAPDAASGSAAGQPGQPGQPDVPHRVPPASVALPVLSQRVALPTATESADRPRRILVADDARVVRVKLQRLLAAQGWQVIEAADGDEALRLLASQRPDLLITDVDMPGLDGFALTRAVRADAASATLPVIMITAADDQHRDEASRAGVTTLLGKPYGEAALLAHMRRLMGLKPATPVVAVAAAAESATA